MRDSTAKRLSALHRVLFRLTGGRVGRRLVNNDMLLLTTTGRTSGAPHTVPLLYLSDDDTVVVIASWGGRDHHPEWYLNLVETPEVKVQIGSKRRAMRAHTAGPEERAVWWERAVAGYRGYRDYQAKTKREIPVVILEPWGSSQSG